MITITRNQLKHFYFHWLTTTFTNKVEFTQVLNDAKTLELYIDEDALRETYNEAKSCPDLW